jgi:putative ABC transport system ATP-binding protein
VRLVLDGRCVLDDLDLEIADCGITVLLGPSGAGKSMTLRLLNRLEVPTSGTVRFRGDDISSLDPLRLRRRVGMVFQQPAVFPGTVRENLRVAAPDAPEDELLACLAAADLDGSFIDRVADELSGGQAQRVCLARTLATRPEVLLMDEPTSALDPRARHRLEETARRLVDDGRPMVWVTHDLDQADRLSDRRVVLVAGRLATGDEVRRYLTGDDGGDDPS